jgi:hypothetical protein
MPAAMSVSSPLPCASSALIGKTRQRQQMPAPPVRLFERAAITPVTAVPCPWSSAGSASPPTKSQPGTSAPRRSGWFGSTPVSTTATTILLDPCVTSHALGKPATRRPSCCGQPASSGLVSAISARGSFAALATAGEDSSAASTRARRSGSTPTRYARICGTGCSTVPPASSITASARARDVPGLKVTLTRRGS